MVYSWWTLSDKSPLSQSFMRKKMFNKWLSFVSFIMSTFLKKNGNMAGTDEFQLPQDIVPLVDEMFLSLQCCSYACSCMHVALTTKLQTSLWSYSLWKPPFYVLLSSRTSVYLLLVFITREYARIYLFSNSVEALVNEPILQNSNLELIVTAVIPNCYR
jgi:hypothetical protein